MSQLWKDPTPDDPMPAFPLLAKDKLAVEAIDYYARLCTQRGLADQAEEVWKAIDEFVAWQVRHPELWKLPDHVHVPASVESAGVSRGAEDPS